MEKGLTLRGFLRKTGGVIGLLMLGFIVGVAVFAPWIAPYDPYQTVEATTGDVLAPPSAAHLLGQDDSGKDVLSSVIYGARISLIVGFSASLIVVVIGTIVGMVSGYAGGWVDMLLMRITDAILVVPTLPLMLVIIAVAGRGITNIILVIGFLSWTYAARVVRSQVLSVKERQFIMRARAIGVGHLRIMTVHILPQVIPVIFAEGILDISYAILSEATLSFLGLGDPTLISWGSILNRAFLRGAVTRGAWWFLIPPGLALAWVTLSLNFIGNALQELINPRLQTHHLFDERKIVLLRRFIGGPAVAASVAQPAGPDTGKGS
jgi:peptide/nickel transport system permease protein